MKPALEKLTNEHSGEWVAINTVYSEKIGRNHTYYVIKDWHNQSTISHCVKYILFLIILKLVMFFWKLKKSKWSETLKETERASLDDGFA